MSKCLRSFSDLHFFFPNDFFFLGFWKSVTIITLQLPLYHSRAILGRGYLGYNVGT